MSEKRILSEEELGNVSGGIAEVDDAQVSGRCPYCTTLLKKKENGYECPDCGSMFDDGMNQIQDVQAPFLTSKATRPFGRGTIRA